MRRSIFAIVAALVFVVSVYAQTSLSLWPYYIEVRPKQSSPDLYELILPGEVMDRARADLADLRLFDGANREVPYAIRIRRDVNEKRQIDARLFNHALAGTVSEVSVDLGESPGEHNEVEIDTGSWPVPPIFTLIQHRGDIADEEMARTFNLGIGMTVVVARAHVDAALGAMPDACRIGRVVEVPEGEPRVRFE